MVVCGGMGCRIVYGFKGGGFEKHCTRASLRSDTVEDLIRLSVEGPSLEMLMLERVWPAGLAKDKDHRKLNYRSWYKYGYKTPV